MRYKGDTGGGGTSRGQSAPVAVILLIGITLAGATAIVAIGGGAIGGVEGQSDLARAEQSMTLFDSQAAQVALGDADSQSVSFGYVNGNYRVDPDAGEISIIQLDCDDTGDGDAGYDAVTNTLSSDDAFILEPTDLGSVLYERDGTTIGYQGGGVWRATDDGVAMVSPPEFHYRGQTLTLPIIQTVGNGSVSGSTTMDISENFRSKRVFANASNSFPSPRCGASARPFLNPVTHGRVVVRIESQFAQAWGDYFSERTAGEVSYPAEDVVLVELVALGDIGEFPMPGDGGSITVPGAADGHNTPAFNFRVRPDDADSADFSNLQWSFYVSEGQKRLEVNLKQASGGDPCGSQGGSGTSVKADLLVYYSDDGGSTYQGWKATDAFDAQCADLNGDGDDEIYMDVTLVDDKDGNGNHTEIEGGDLNLTNTGLSSGSLVQFSPDDRTSTFTFSGHGDWESETYNDGDEETIDRLINHYFAELPEDFELTVDDKNSDSINEDVSSGFLETTGDGSYVTYLHVTRNEIEVTIQDE